MKTLIEGKNFKLRRKKKDQQWADDVSNLDIQRNNIGKIKTSERRSTTEMFFLQERIQTENKKGRIQEEIWHTRENNDKQCNNFQTTFEKIQL